jgi:fimbrial chaperone protein
MFSVNATWRSPLGCAFLFLGALAAPWTQAGSFQVSPVRATLSATHGVGSMTVRNDGSEPTVVQLQVVSWSQDQGKDVYAPTKEILATPPIFTVPPGGAQVVRVGLRRSPDSQRELAYRLYLQEVPRPSKPGLHGLQVALRFGVPVFVKPAAAAGPVLRWQAFRTSREQLKVSLTNDGNAHVQVANFKLGLPGGAELATYQAAAYVLPGQSREWLLKTSAQPGATLHIHAQTDAGDIQSDVVVEKP